MSGHSKWSTIKRKKSAEDAKRGKLFTRLARDITLAARNGGDPGANPALRLAIEKAKAANMPKENIERAIKRGTGELEGGAPEEVMYEGYAPHGVALLIKCLTDNRNRTLAEVRRVLNRGGGSLAEAGAVTWMFETKGLITIERGGRDPDDLFMMAVDAGAEDVDVSSEIVEIYTAPTDLRIVAEALQKRGIKVEEAELSMVPKTLVSLDEKETLQVLHLIEQLEELDDVQQIYSNLDVPEEILATA
ncbi:MAG: YebC/PmpR family DNA-binding transcriptional regulator [Anaerolineae bacterium]|nr:YebC/PmpR family DNA-binding transcriptional regulator [Anaerolineae bacterium]MDW8070771.1 YebC/PmpR family DNA-binding transcriptional regulator [Anaerolineae bacterium]